MIKNNNLANSGDLVPRRLISPFADMRIYKNHNRKSFFKYTSAQTALLIFKHTKLRWSAPSVFNDPFDVPRVIFEDY